MWETWDEFEANRSKVAQSWNFAAICQEKPLKTARKAQISWQV
jgi:hypothetical protein